MKQAPKNFNPEPYAYHEELEIRIDGLNHLGAGVGRDNGWVIFVPLALPGERVLIRIWRNKKNYSDADLVEVLEKSPERVEPVCSLFGECGGCQYQHFSYKGQLSWITERVGELLKRLGGLEVSVNPCIGSSKEYGYRSKITPHFRKPPHFGNIPIGFQRAESRSIVDVEYCPIASDAINRELPEKREALKGGSPKFKRGGTLLMRDAEEGVVTDMRAVVTERVGEFSFRFVAGEFFQNNPHVLPLMIDYAVGQALAKGIRYLADVYCGVGVFGICAHREFDSVTGIEVNERAIVLAQENAKINGVENITFMAGSAEDLFRDLVYPANETAFIIDPPRKGCDEVFLRQALEYAPARIVYVSCGPDTQARDARILVDGGYEIEAVQPFDLFPQTRHIENVITFVRTGSDRD